MPIIYSPGEPVFDQDTGDVVIDPTTGDAVIVAAGEVWSDPVTGKVHQQDDVANAAYWRVNTFRGEVLRDARAGVDYHDVVFAAPFVEDLVLGEITAAILDTPGVAAITEARIVSYDPLDRSALFAFRVRKRDGSSAPAAVTLVG